jgi:hypothetical protein
MNILQKKAEKKLKYRNLIAEIQKMWNMKCIITPTVVGAAGIVTEGLKHLEAIPGKYSTDHLHTHKQRKCSCTGYIAHKR